MTKKFLKLQFLFLCLILVSACSTNKVHLNYVSPNIVSSDGANAAISSVIVQDSRGTAADWLGAIRGGFGNRLKTLLTEKPVREIVENAYSSGLEARGFLEKSGSGKLELTVDIIKFDCSQYVRREAHATFLVSLIDLESAQNVHSKAVQVDLTSGSIVALDVGIFGSVEQLRLLANDALQEAIDKTLDDPAFRSSLVP